MDQSGVQKSAVSKPSMSMKLTPIQQNPGNLPFRSDYERLGQQEESQSPTKKKQVAFEQPEDDEGERKKEKLEPPPSHMSSMTHATFLNDPHFRSCYPVGAKIVNFIKLTAVCKSATRSYVDILKDIDKLNQQSFNKDETYRKKTEGKTIYMKVMNTSVLELDTNVMHPFVRIHIVNMVTGCYIQKSHIDQNAVFNFETNCVIEINKENNNRERRSCELELIPPFATNCCDLRITGSSRAIWNEQIDLNEYADDIYNNDVVILFEILDFNPMYLMSRKTEKLDVDNFYRIAWAYLRPSGVAKFHMGTVRLQLYNYIFDSRALNPNERRESIPLVYYDFIWAQKNEYSGVLNVLFMLHEKPEFQNVFEKSRSVYQIERGDRDLKKKMHHQIEEREEDEYKEELTDLDKRNLRRRRFINDKSQVPDKIAYKFASAPLGCYRLAFNKKGNYLAAACTYKSSKTIIKLIDVEQGLPFGCFKGHSNLIHDLRFSPTSQYLISVSSDQTAKIWRVPKHSGEEVDEDESDHYLIAQLSHPSFVYAGLFLSEGSTPLIATACFDSRIRIWRVNSRFNLQVKQDPEQSEVISTTGETFDNFDDLLDHRHPNCMVYDGSRRLYVGDSLGGIHIYDINNTMSAKGIATRINFVLHPEMDGDAINSLTLVPPEMKDLLVHSRDNCIRTLEVNSTQGKYSDGQMSGAITGRFFGTVTQKLAIRSTMSPCGEFILSGSEDGKPHMWDNVGIVQPTTQFQYSLIGPISDVAWNDTYHMIALAGFGDEHPIVIYTWERNEDMNLQEYKDLQEKLITQKQRKTEEDETTYQPPAPTDYREPFTRNESPARTNQINLVPSNQPFGGVVVNQRVQNMGNRPF